MVNLPKANGSTSQRRLASPVVVTAFLWIGLQILVALYLRSLIGALLHHEPHLLIALQRALTAPGAGGLSLRAWLWGINLAFVLLLWLRLRFQRWRSHGERFAALLVYGGTSLLLLLTNTLWTRLLR